jgi:hypothetical protein
VLILNASTVSEIDTAFATLVQQRTGALVVAGDAFLSSRRNQIVALAARHGMPAIYFNRDFAVAGGLGNLGGNAQRSRHALNADTIRAMHEAFRDGGRAAIDKVMKEQPAVFLKLLVLLVPREMRVERSGGVKDMSDGQIEAAIEAIQAMLAAREVSENAKVIDTVPEPVALPAPSRKPRRKRGAEAKASPLLPESE